MPDPTTPEDPDVLELRRVLAAEPFARRYTAPKGDAAVWAAITALLHSDSRLLVLCSDQSVTPLEDAEAVITALAIVGVRRAVRLYGCMELDLCNGSRIVFVGRRTRRRGANWTLIEEEQSP